MSGMQKYKTDCLTKKESLLSSNNHLLIFFLLSFILVTPTLNAQIKIEERVEIAPQQILSDDPQFALELRISVYPSLLAPGDIREIGLSLCERRSFYGCYIIDFPQGQLFDAAITWDPFPGENEYNTPKLVSGTQVSDTLLGVEEGFYFKAPEYLTVSYMVAVLEVKTYISGYGLIQDDYLVSMMLDTSLVISFNPANILPSDTSEIVIEKIRSDGVKIAYHPLQQFEVGIIEGCTAGKLLAAGDTASYFNRVTQPIYFVAADSIDEEEDTLKIRVGLNQELIDTYLPLKIKYEKQLAKQEKEERGELKVTEEEKPVEQNPIDNPMISSCSFSTFESFLYEDITKTLQDECDFENCSDTYADIQVQLFRQYNNFEFRSGETISVCKCDTCTTEKYPTGQSTPVPFYSKLRKNQNGEWVNTWNLVACKNVEDKIELRPVATDINMPISIYVDFIADVCYELINQFGNILVNDTTELKDENKIPDSDLDDIVDDICGHYCYPQVISEGGYILKEDVELHELLHMSHYQKILNDTKIDSLVNELKKDLIYSCQYYQQYIKTPEGASGDFKSKINQYIVKAEREYRKQSGLEYTDYFGNVHPGDPVKERKNELKIQNNLYLQNLIDSYHFALSKARGTDYPVTCFTCPQ